MTGKQLEREYDKICTTGPSETEGPDQIDLSHLPEKEREEITKITDKYDAAFSRDKYDIGEYTDRCFDLEVIKLWYSPPRDPFEPKKREALTREIENLLKAGIIEENVEDDAKTNASKSINTNKFEVMLKPLQINVLNMIKIYKPAMCTL